MSWFWFKAKFRKHLTIDEMKGELEHQKAKIKCWSCHEKAIEKPRESCDSISHRELYQMRQEGKL